MTDSNQQLFAWSRSYSQPSRAILTFSLDNTAANKSSSDEKDEKIDRARPTSTAHQILKYRVTRNGHFEPFHSFIWHFLDLFHYFRLVILLKFYIHLGNSVSSQHQMSSIERLLSSRTEPSHHFLPPPTKLMKLGEYNTRAVATNGKRN